MDPVNTIVEDMKQRIEDARKDKFAVSEHNYD